MPAVSNAQRRFLYGTKGPAWVAEHHFNTNGPLPEHVGDKKPEEAKKKKPTVKAAHNQGENMSTFAEKVVTAMQVAGVALTRAEQAQAEKQAQESAVAGLIPGCVEALYANGRIDAEDKTAAAQALRDPTKAIELLTKVAAHRNPTEASRIGTAVDNGRVKQAAANGMNSAYVGAVATGEKEADRRFLAGLGLS